MLQLVRQWHGLIGSERDNDDRQQRYSLRAVILTMQLAWPNATVRGSVLPKRDTKFLTTEIMVHLPQVPKHG